MTAEPQTDLERTKDYFARLDEFIRNCLVNDVDFGRYGTAKKPSLLQPGADKLMHWLQLHATYPVITPTERWEDAPPLLSYIVQCRLLTINDECAGEAYGSCNSRENQYKSQNVYQIANTLVKMAQKRARVAAVVMVAGVSQHFTQDMEDVTAHVTATAKPMASAQSWRQRFLTAQEQMGFEWAGMSRACRSKWLTQLTQTPINESAGPSEDQWRICAESFEKYLRAAQGNVNATGLSFLRSACKQFCNEWEPDVREDITASIWAFLADNWTAISHTNEAGK